jgi:hypothetical protein
MKEAELDWYMGYPVQKYLSNNQDERVVSDKILLNLSTPC